jgi:outer membrane protein assembly complex protein YaeT
MGSHWKILRLVIPTLFGICLLVRAECSKSENVTQDTWTPWTIDPSLDISEADLSTLKKRFPAITEPSDLTKLLLSTGYKIPTSSLFVELVNGTWIITGKPASTVIAIDFKLAPLAIVPALRGATSSWIGQVHSVELLNKVDSDIESFLRKIGYKNANVSMTTTSSDWRTEYLATLDIGAPCIIRGFLWPEPLPSGIDSSSDIGEICDETITSTAIDAIETQLHEKGWINAHLEFNGFFTQEQQSLAFVRVRGSVGDKIVYRFVDSITGLDFSNELLSEEQKLLVPIVSNPDAVPHELTHLLRRRGFIDVLVTGPEIRKDSPNVATYVYYVQKGEQHRLASLTFEGHDFFSTSDLVSFMRLDVSRNTNDGKSFSPFNPDAVSEGLEAINGRYKAAGFWDAKVTDRISQPNQNDRKLMQVVVSIDEGTRRLFDSIELDGNNIISNDDIMDLWKISEGSPFDRSQAIDFQQKIRSSYANLGYFYANATIDLRPKELPTQDLGIVISVKITEGPRVKFGDIFVTGLVKTRAHVVTREVLFETGDWYDPELVVQSRKSLLRLGVFSSVVISQVDSITLTDRDNMLDIIIDVKESPSRSLSFGPGWSSFYGMRYNFEGSLTNIAGTGRQIFSRAAFTQEKSQFAIGPRTLIGRSISAGYLEPHILDSVIDGTVSGSQTARSSDYAWTLTRGGELEASHTLRLLLPGSRIAAFVGRKLNEEEGRVSAKDAFLADTYSVGRTGLRFNIDSRDDATWPTDGYILSSELSWAEYALGGNLKYFRWELGNSHYFSATDNFVFALGYQISAYQHVTRRDEGSLDILPASERLSAGGTESVRGFRERSLGPIVRRPNIDESRNWLDCGFTSSATGGSRRTLLKAESRYRWTDAIATTLFIDSGNTSFSAEEMSKFEKAFNETQAVEGTSNCPGIEPKRTIEDNIGYEVSELLEEPHYLWDKHFTSVGLALNFLTPIGSVNLAYGMPWHEPTSTKCKSKPEFCFFRSPQNVVWWKKGEVHFNVGAKF